MLDALKLYLGGPSATAGNGELSTGRGAETQARPWKHLTSARNDRESDNLMTKKGTTQKVARVQNLFLQLTQNLP